MASSPHIEMRKALGQEESWAPTWARRLRKTGDVYEAAPVMVYPREIQELGQLAAQGHSVSIDTQRLGATRIRISPRTN